CSDNGFNEPVLYRRTLAPGHVAVALVLLGGGVHNLQQATGAVPGVAGAVDDENVVESVFGRVNGFNEAIRVEGRGEVDNVEIEDIGVFAGAAMLGIDHGHTVAQSGGHGKGAVGLAGSGRSGDGEA